MTSQQEAEQIAQWHVKCFRGLGLAEGTIDVLLAWGSDPHEVEGLFRGERKPTDEQVLRIVQPLDDVAVLVPVVEAEQFSVKV